MTGPPKQDGPPRPEHAGAGEDQSSPQGYRALRQTQANARPDSASWRRAKPFGDAAERAVAEYFKSRGFVPFLSIGSADFDLLLQAGVEVKHDAQAERTGNIAVEVSYRERPSGIRTSTATYWAIVAAGQAYIVRTADLRALVERGGFREVPAGDGGRARVRLVPLDRLAKVRDVRIIALPDLRPQETPSAEAAP